MNKITRQQFILSLLFLMSCFVGNLSAQSGWLWGKKANANTGYAEGYAVCNDNAGNIFATGEFGNAGLNFGTISLPNTGYGDVFVVKYDASGMLLWAKGATGSSFEQGFGIASDAFGNVYVAGETQSPTTTFGSYPLATLGSADGFLVKYDQAGTVIWAKRFGGYAYDQARSVHVDGSGNIYVTGIFESPSIPFGTTTLTNTGNSNLFLAKFDSNGNNLWAKSTSGASEAMSFSVTNDNDANVFITGFFTTASTINFGSIALTTTGTQDIFVAKYDAGGNELWVKEAGGTVSGDNEGYSISADPSGNVFVCGFYSSPSITIGSTTLTNAAGGYYDAFIVKYDMNGNILWVRGAGGSLDDRCFSVSADTSGNAYVVGGYNNPTITFGSTTLTAGTSNCSPFPSCDPIFLVKYDANGNVICASTLVSGGDDQSGVSADRYGNAYYVSDYVANPFIVGPDTLAKQGVEDFFIAKYNCNTDAGINNGSAAGNGINIFPNPSNGKFNLEMKDFESVKAPTFEVYNSYGEKILSGKITSEKTEIDLSIQASGIYLVMFKTENKMFTRKVMIQK